MLDQILLCAPASTASGHVRAGTRSDPEAVHHDGNRRPVDAPLEMLSRRLMDVRWIARLASDDTLEPLITMALKHVEALKDQGLRTIPWPVAMFGRAHVTTRKLAYLHPNSLGSVKFLDLDTGKRDRLEPAEMRYGAPVDPSADITTDKSGALLLYDHGACRCIQPYRSGSIRALAEPGAKPLDLRASQ